MFQIRKCGARKLNSQEISDGAVEINRGTKMRLFVVAGANGRIGRIVSQRLLEQNDTLVLEVDRSFSESTPHTERQIRLIDEVGGSTFTPALQRVLSKLTRFAIPDGDFPMTHENIGLFEQISKVTEVWGEIYLSGIVNLMTGTEPKASDSTAINSHSQISEAMKPGLARDLLVRKAWSLYSIEDFRLALDSNLVSTHALMTALYPFFERDGANVSVINISSQYAKRPPVQNALLSGNSFIFKPPGYSAAKAGLENYTAYCAQIFRGTEIRFNCLAIGAVRTNQTKEFVENYGSYVIKGRMVNIEEIYPSIHYLLSGGTNYMTGEVIHLDGGWSLG